jgi:hypothetical protein
MSGQPTCTYDSNGKEIHYKGSTGYEEWHEYDANGKCIHYKNSGGYEWWREFDSNGNQIHYKNNKGDENWYWEGKVTDDPVKILLLSSQLHSKAS